MTTPQDSTPRFSSENSPTNTVESMEVTTHDHPCTFSSPSVVPLRDLFIQMLLDIPKSKRLQHVREIYRLYKIDLASDPLLQDNPPKPRSPTNFLEEIKSTIPASNSITVSTISQYTPKNLNKNTNSLILELQHLEGLFKESQRTNIYWAYWIGYYLHEFKDGRIDDVLQQFKWKKSWRYFLIQFYVLINEYPKLLLSTKSLYFFQKNILKIREELFIMTDSEKTFWRQQP
jgi:hypothetical protein